MSAPPQAVPSLDELMLQLEELWACCDILLADLPAPKWHDKFGRDWEYADVPRHLAYFDQIIIAEPIRLGASIPAEKQVSMDTHRQFNAWNERMLAEYRRNDSIEFALSQMSESRNAIRHAIAPLSAKDADRPVWISLTGFTGWRTARFALELCRQHTWAHLSQLRLRLKRTAPVVNPAITHAALNSIIHSLTSLLDQNLAQRIQLVATLTLTGPGGGRWAFCIGKGTCKVTAGESDIHPDVELALTTQTFVEILSGMRNPVAALFTGYIQVSGWQYLPLFFRLFARPHPDKRLVPSS